MNVTKIRIEQVEGLKYELDNLRSSIMYLENEVKYLRSKLNNYEDKDEAQYRNEFKY